MKSNFEIMQIKGIRLQLLEDQGGIGWLEIEGKLPESSVMFTRGKTDRPGSTHEYNHVSIAPLDGHTPTWDEMCVVKDLFFREDEEVVQIHPVKENYVNLKKNCLHLWQRTDGTMY